MRLSKEKPFILPSNICPIVITTFLKAKVPFICLDICLKTFEIDRDLLLKKIKERPDYYGGILWLRPYGLSRNNKKLFKSIKKINNNLFIIDDCCLSVPKFSFQDNYQDLTLFSTGYSKYVDFGWGGFGHLNTSLIDYSVNEIKFNNKDLIKLTTTIQESIDTRTKFKYIDSSWLGGNVRCKFEEYKKNISNELPAISKHKNKINSIYSSIISHSAQFPKGYQQWRFNIYANNKKRLLEKLFAEKLFASSHYYPITELLSLDSSINSNFLHSNVINLFNDYRYNEKMAKKTAYIANKHILKWGYKKFE